MAPRFQARFEHGDPLMVDHTPAAAVAAGEVVTIGSELFIAHNDIEADKLGALGAPGANAVYEVAKAGATVFAAGDTVYWNDTTKVAVSTGPADGILGVAVEAAGNGPEVVMVRHDRAAIS